MEVLNALKIVGPYISSCFFNCHSKWVREIIRELFYSHCSWTREVQNINKFFLQRHHQIILVYNVR